jgi:hypothetical protein
MMRAYVYLSKCPSFLLIQKKFPDFVEFSKSIEVVPWEDEYAVVDYNPEVIDFLEHLNKLLDMKAKTEEEYEREVSKLPSYACKTGGIALIEKGAVSFRSENPSERIIVHEIGHCYFRESDLVWDYSYGGGEGLFWLIIKDDLPLNEGAIFQWHSWLRRTLEGKVEEVAEEIVGRLSKLNLPVFPHIYTYQLFGGTIGVDMDKIPPHLFEDLASKEWERVKVSRVGMLTFLDSIITGAILEDTVCSAYLRALFLY